MARGFRRTMIVAALGLLSVLLLFMLFPPFFSPETHLVLIGSRADDGLNLPPLPFVAEDLEALAEIPEVVATDHSEAWSSAATAKQLGRYLEESGLSAREQLILYVNAHTIAVDGKVFLICDNFDLRSPELGRVSIQSFLQQVRQVPAKRKLIVLNAGSVVSDSRLGVVDNDFTMALSAAVQATQDASLWLYVSHQDNEQSYPSPSANRSVFGMFVSAGLQGAADLNGDRQVQLSELVAFTSANTSNWVRQASDRQARQTPRLFWGGGEKLTSNPTLISLYETDAPLTVASLIGLSPAGDAAGFHGASGTMQGVLNRHRSAHASGATQTAGAKPTGATTTAASESGGDSDAAVANDQEGESGKAASAAGGGEVSAESLADQRFNQYLKDRQQALANLQSAWEERDQAERLFQPLSPIHHPIEAAPHLWNELQAELLKLEEELAGGQAYRPENVDGVLEKITKAKSAPADDPAAASKQPENQLPALLDEPLNGSQLAMLRELRQSASSMALIELLDEIPGVKQPSTLKPAAPGGGNRLESLRVTLSAADAKPLQQWFKTKSKPSDVALRDLVYLRKLAASDIDWRLIQRSARCCLLGERLAALDLVSPGWVRDHVERADQLRFFAEQLLLDQIGIDWEIRSEELLSHASGLYRDAEAELVTIRNAQWALQQTLSKVPSYLTWYTESSDHLAKARAYQQLQALLASMSKASQLLSDPAQGDADALAGLTRELYESVAMIEQFCGSKPLQRLNGRPPQPGDTTNALTLLASPVGDGVDRMRVRMEMPARSHQLASAFQLANVSPQDGLLKHLQASNEHQPGAADELQRWQQRAELIAAWMKLGMPYHVQQSDESPVVIAIKDAEQALQRFHEARKTSDKEAGGREITQIMAGFERAVGQFYSAMIPGIELSLLATSEADRLAATRLLGMLDPRDAFQLSELDVDSLLLRSRVASTSQWQQRRTNQWLAFHALPLADPNDTAVETKFATASPLKVTVSGKIDLRYQDDQVVDVSLYNPSQQSRTVSVSVEYQQQLLRLQMDSTFAWTAGVSQFGSRRMTQLDIPAGETVEIPLQVRRQPGASASSTFIFDVFDQSTLELSSAAPTVLLHRSRLPVEMPVAELVAVQGQRQVMSGGQGLTWKPYPNRVADFKLGVTNRSGIEKNIKVACYPLSGPISQQMWDEPVDAFLGIKPLTEFKVVASGDGQVAFAKLAEAETPPKPAKDAIAAKADSSAAKAEPSDGPAKRPPSTAMPSGMAVVLTDLESGESTLRPITFAVQRPRRFVRPRVGYDVINQRIRVDVQPINVKQLPLGKPVEVSCELANDFGGRAQGKMRGQLIGSPQRASMFINMPSPPPQVARVHLNVDGYPRAFIYDVACNEPSNDVPEVKSLMSIQIDGAAKGRTIKSGLMGAADAIDLNLKIDAPIGSFEHRIGGLDQQADEVELGLDLEKSGQPAPGTIVRLNSDRQVRVGFVKAKPDGTITLDTEVADASVSLTTKRLENLEVDVTSRLTVNGVSKAFPNASVMIDTAAPIVGPVNRTDGLSFAGVNQELDFEVWAWDEAASVTEVIAAFDVDGSGEFPEAGPTFSASQIQGRRWSLSVPVGARSGTRRLLVKGIDAVGNESDPIGVEIEVVSLEQQEQLVEGQTVTLIGKVLLREKTVSGAQLLLVEVADPAVAPAQPTAPGKVFRAVSDPEGNFALNDVPPGAYKLASRGVVRNKVHRTELPVVVEVGPKRQQRTDVVLP